MDKDSLYQLGLDFKQYNSKNKSEITDEEIKRFKGETWESLNDKNGQVFSSGEAFRSYVKKRQSKENILPSAEEYKSEQLEVKNKELIEQQIALDSRKQQFRDELTYINKVKRPISRTEAMCEVLKEITPTLPMQSPYIFIKPSKKRRIIVPLMSDGQVGELVKLEDTAGFNTYNFEVFKRRQQQYFNEIINDSQELGITEAFVPFLGDDVEGNGKIYKRQKFYLEAHVVKQIFKVSESNAWFLQSLNNAGIQSIKTMAVAGNHGNDDYDNHAQANFDVVAFDRTKLLLRDNKNIDYQYSESYMEVVNILGYNFLVIHGDGLNKQSLENAFYKYSYMYSAKGIQLYGLLCGHFHVPMTLDVMSTAGSIIINGNIVGSNHLSVQKLQSDNKPSQTYIVIEEGKGITYQRKVVLD